jgi:hypothetical protein
MQISITPTTKRIRLISITIPTSATLTMRDMSSTGKEAVKEIGK